MTRRAKAARFGYSRKTWTWITIFLVLVFVLDVIWMLTVPMDKSPDEYQRIILSNYIYLNGRLPNAWEPAVRIEGWGFSYALRPMLVNILGAFNMRFVSLFTTSTWALVLSVRIISVISGVTMVYFCFRICEWLEWKPAWAFFFGSVCAFTPQITFLCSYHNNDIFSMACVTAVLYCWVRGMKENWTWADCYRLAIALGLTILSYYNAYPYVLFSIPVFFLTAFHRGMSRAAQQLVWKKTFVIIGITFLIAGWWFIRNMYLYDGDVLGMRTRLVMGELYGDPNLKPSAVFKPYREGISYFDVWNYTTSDGFSWSRKTFFSTIALLGIMDFLFPAEIYDFAARLLTIGLVLFVIQYVVWIVASLTHKVNKQRIPITLYHHLLFYFFAALSALLVIGLSMYYSWTDDFQPQGRYIMPAFTTFALVMVAGYRSIGRALVLMLGKERWDSIFSWVFCSVLCLILLGIQGYAYWRISPTYLNKYPRVSDPYLNYLKTYGMATPKPSESELDALQRGIYEEMEEMDDEVSISQEAFV